jgi:hypothetical protein
MRKLQLKNALIMAQYKLKRWHTQIDRRGIIPSRNDMSLLIVLITATHMELAGGASYNSPSAGNSDKKVVDGMSLFPGAKVLKLPLQSSRQEVFQCTFGTGIGFFPMISVPVGTTANYEDNEAPDGGTTSRRAGIPFYLSGDYTNQSERWNFTPIFLSFITIKAGSDPQGHLDSSYGRVDGGSGLTFKQPTSYLGISQIHWTGRISYRRSTFSSMSIAHYLASPMVSAQLDLFWRFFSIGAEFSEGIRPEFGFTDQLLWGGHQLPSSSATLRGKRANAHWFLNYRTALLLEIDQEISQINLENLQDYSLFNLDTEGLFGGHHIMAETLITKIGFKKAF